MVINLTTWINHHYFHNRVTGYFWSDLKTSPSTVRSPSCPVGSVYSTGNLKSTQFKQKLDILHLSLSYENNSTISVLKIQYHQKNFKNENLNTNSTVCKIRMGHEIIYVYCEGQLIRICFGSYSRFLLRMPWSIKDIMIKMLTFASVCHTCINILYAQVINTTSGVYDIQYVVPVRSRMAVNHIFTSLFTAVKK